jgi:hypothetical protein
MPNNKKQFSRKRTVQDQQLEIAVLVEGMAAELTTKPPYQEEDFLLIKHRARSAVLRLIKDGFLSRINPQVEPWLDIKNISIIHRITKWEITCEGVVSA